MEEEDIEIEPGSSAPKSLSSFFFLLLPPPSLPIPFSSPKGEIEVRSPPLKPAEEEQEARASFLMQNIANIWCSIFCGIT